MGFHQTSILSFGLSWIVFVVVGTVIPVMTLQLWSCSSCEEYQVKGFEFDVLATQASLGVVSLLCKSYDLRKYQIRLSESKIEIWIDGFFWFVLERKEGRKQDQENAAKAVVVVESAPTVTAEEKRREGVWSSDDGSRKVLPLSAARRGGGWAVAVMVTAKEKRREGVWS
ncbi:hypothetical protein Droror1_Dr00026687 [Drosera rotundifolia]